MPLRRITPLLGVLGLLALVLGPVCGSPVDVDPDACCERHAAHHPEEQETPDPAKCCEQGRHAFPDAKLSAADVSSVSWGALYPLAAEVAALDSAGHPSGQAACISPSPPGTCNQLYESICVLRI